MGALLPPRYVESCQGPMLEHVVIETVDGRLLYQDVDHDRTATIEVGTEPCMWWPDVGVYVHPAMPWELMWYPPEGYPS